MRVAVGFCLVVGFCALRCWFDLPFKADRPLLLFPESRQSFLSLTAMDAGTAAISDDRADYIHTDYNFSCYSQTPFQGKPLLVRYFERRLWKAERHMDDLLMSVLPDAPKPELGCEDNPMYPYHCRRVKAIPVPESDGFIKASKEAYHKTGATGLVSTILLDEGS
ncbi:MAG TPA: hypothetical protein DEW74_00925 [Opitutae bacterium]|nr:hypothetical protein [Opitutae bacterium]